MDNTRKTFNEDEIFAELGIEDKLNEFLDSEDVRSRLLPKYQAVKANLTEVLNRLPEKCHEKAAELINEKLQSMDEEVFVEVVLGKFWEDVGHSLWTLSKYLDISAVTQQLLDSVAEGTALLACFEKMAEKLADALRRALKMEVVKLCSEECESAEEFQSVMHTIFDGDEDAPVIIAVEGLENLAEGLASVLTDIILGESYDPDDEDEEDDDDQPNPEGEKHCCCGSDEGEVHQCGGEGCKCATFDVNLGNMDK